MAATLEIPNESSVQASFDNGTHPALVYLARLGSDASRRTQRQALERVARLLTEGSLGALDIPWHELRYQHTQAVRAALGREVSARTGKPLSPSYINTVLAALRGVLREAWRLGLMSAEGMQRATDFVAVRGTTLPAGRALSQGEVRSLVAACAADPSPAGARDAAVLALGLALGLRRAEMVSLGVEDLDLTTGEVRVERGKGRKARVVWATGGALAALSDWVEVRGDERGPLLVHVNKGGRVVVRGISANAVVQLLQKRAREAGVASFSPHDLRRTFIGDLLDAGADISTVQQLAGHASVTTTQGYDRRPEAAKREAAGRLHFPYTTRQEN